MVKEFIVSIVGGFYASGHNLLDKPKTKCDMRREVSFEKIKYAKLAHLFTKNYAKINPPPVKRRVRFQWDPVERIAEKPSMTEMNHSSLEDDKSQNEEQLIETGLKELSDEVKTVEFESAKTYALASHVDTYSPEPEHKDDNPSVDKTSDITPGLLGISDIPTRERLVVEENNKCINSASRPVFEKAESYSKEDHEIIVSEDDEPIKLNYSGYFSSDSDTNSDSVDMTKKSRVDMIKKISTDDSSYEEVVVDDQTSEYSDDDVTMGRFYCYYIPIKYKPKSCIKPTR